MLAFRSASRILLVAMTLTCAAACGLDETYTGLGDGALKGDPLNPWPIAVTCDCVGGGGCTQADTATGEVDNGTLDVADLTGFGWRFDSLVETAPITGLIGDQLNKYFVDNIASDAFNVLMLATADDRDAGTLTFHMGAGAKGDDGYGLNAGAGTLACTLDGARFATATPMALSFPNSMLAPPELPLNDVRVSGLFSADGTSITEGQLTGALTEADATATKIAGAQLAATLKGLKLDKNLDLDGDGTNDAWRFVFTFTAARANVSE
jgi:hypothetical protein